MCFFGICFLSRARQPWAMRGHFFAAMTRLLRQLAAEFSHIDALIQVAAMAAGGLAGGPGRIAATRRPLSGAPNGSRFAGDQPQRETPA